MFSHGKSLFGTSAGTRESNLELDGSSSPLRDQEKQSLCDEAAKPADEPVDLNNANGGDSFEEEDSAKSEAAIASGDQNGEALKQNGDNDAAKDEDATEQAEEAVVDVQSNTDTINTTQNSSGNPPQEQDDDVQQNAAEADETVKAQDEEAQDEEETIKAQEEAVSLGEERNVEQDAHDANQAEDIQQEEAELKAEEPKSADNSENTVEESTDANEHEDMKAEEEEEEEEVTRVLIGSEESKPESEGQDVEEKNETASAQGSENYEQESAPESPSSVAAERQEKDVKEEEEDEEKVEPEEQAEKEEEEEEEKEEVKSAPRRRGRVSLRSQAAAKNEDANTSKAEEQEEEEEDTTPRRTRGRGAKKDAESSTSIQESPRTPGTRGRKPKEVKQAETPEESEPEQQQESARRSSRRSAAKADSATAAATPKTSQPVETPKSSRGRPRAAAKETPVNTPRGRGRPPKTPKAESEDDKSPEPEVRATRGSRQSQASTDSTPPAKRSVGRPPRSATKSEPEKTPKTRGQPSTSTASAKKPTSSPAKAHDPFDFKEMEDEHPEPLKNIQLDVHQFGEIRFSKVRSESAYSNTEKAAQERVGIAAETTTPKFFARRSLMDVTREEVAAAVTRSAPAKRTKKATEFDDDDAIETPKRFRAAPSTTPSSSSAGRKRKSSPEPAKKQKRPSIEPPQLSPEEQLHADLPADGEQPGVLPGARVYALYDKVFYPAIVLECDSLSRYQVYFVEDQIVKSEPDSSVIPIATLQAGSIVVMNTDDKTLRFEVLSPPPSDEWATGTFQLQSEYDEDNPNASIKKIEANWDQLMLDINDYKDYIKQRSAHSTDIKKANIDTDDTHKSTRRSRGSAQSSTVTTPAPEPKKLVAKRTPTPKVQKAPKAQAKVAPNTSSLPKIFSGFSFCLTSANRVPENTIPFHKNELKATIIARGGTIIDTLVPDVSPNSFLISDTFYRTQKYLWALANDVPCVSHEWLIKCTDSNTLLDYKKFLLPAGKSVIDDQIRAQTKLKGKLLLDKRIYIYSANPKVTSAMTFTEIWTPVAEALGARIMARDDISKEKFDVVITDASCTADIISIAKKQGAVVVSSEWIIQGIINGKLLSADNNLRFAHNFVTHNQ